MPQTDSNPLYRVRAKLPEMPVVGPDEMGGARQGKLLPVEYFHVVFTLPEPIARIA
jgi:hypothetical protein